MTPDEALMTKAHARDECVYWYSLGREIDNRIQSINHQAYVNGRELDDQNSYAYKKRNFG